MMKRLTMLLTLAAAATTLINGCASPEARYYTLAASPSDAAPAGTSRAGRSGDPLWIEVTPVRVPERLNRIQLVVRDGNGGLKLSDTSRWTSPLPNELRDALSQQLQASLDAVDVYQRGLSATQPAFRVTTDVVALDADVGKRAAATIAWTVRRLPDGKVLSGRTETEVPAPGQVEGVVKAYREILATTAADIAVGVQSLNR
ncbi:membrane integrity-associated transporter subunit PqiC [Cupriavidus sp. IK-TO18]|uniref:PqiC family protein n=1 Tax=Cupriavidus sp. IK-TO18 TaxID=2782182 RepID=UPI00189B8E98|nr:PqiC family protein [Cupriavidus sp. IK-TO18]MBF6988738.1 membrane integrity-associated transporter subunit PqiC [Cupriavidus sp. IK-TO18]